MRFNSLKHLREEKDKKKEELEALRESFYRGELEKKKYLEKKYELLDGDFEEEAFGKLDRQIAEEKKKRWSAGSIIGLVLVAIMIFNVQGGITGFAAFGTETGVNLVVNNTYEDDSVLDLTFVNATSVRASGKVYGHGEAWIYLVDGGERKLVYYADTRTGGGPTGFVAANLTENQTSNSTNKTTASGNTTINSTLNETGNTTNTTTNETNIVVNSTNATINSTLNATNQTVNVTSNQTMNETGNTTNTTTNETIVGFWVDTDKAIYELGETVNIDVTPERADATVYLHTPSTTELLTGDTWTVTKAGEYRVSALITYQNKTERKTADFSVLTEQPTAIFTRACTETCSIPGTGIDLEIEVDGVRLKFDNVTYTPTEGNETINATGNQTENESDQTSQEVSQGQPQESTEEGQSEIALMRKCLNPNPNARPRECFNGTEWDERFPAKNFTLVNTLGMTMARFDGAGNMHIEGNVVEGATGSPDKYDLTIGGNNPTIWIDASTKDLYLKGQIYENQETLMWESRKDYVVSNSRGMYLGVFEANGGDLYLRGELRGGSS